MDKRWRILWRRKFYDAGERQWLRTSTAVDVEEDSGVGGGGAAVGGGREVGRDEVWT